MNNLPVARSPSRILILVLGLLFLCADVNVGDLPFNSSVLVTVCGRDGRRVLAGVASLSGYRHDERSGIA
ncbi:hypothetical protein KCP73_02865 [Salmonella enterica subsp. enterica]|nr:hypothetical protein KCP73_02865 [Salmonella enterica subsp. enterica]